METIKSILIISDDQPLINNVKKQFQELITDFTIESVAGHQQALNTLCVKRFDLCLLDIEIESNNGFEVLEDIDTSKAKDVPLTKDMDVLTLHESLKMNKIKVEPMSQELLAEFKRIKLLGSGIIKS